MLLLGIRVVAADEHGRRTLLVVRVHHLPAPTLLKAFTTCARTASAWTSPPTTR